LTVLRSSILLVALLLSFFPLRAIAQSSAGSVTKLDGKVSIERGGRSIAAVLAMPVLIGDKIETTAQSNLTIVLSDGSEISLSESSSIVIDQTMVGTARADSFINLFKGRLHSVVNPRGGTLPAFEVRTPNAVVGVRGTDFETEYVEGKPCPGFPKCSRYTDVGVYSGVVEVRNPTSAHPSSVRVSSGHETTVPCELPPATPGPLGMGDLTAPGYH
jgi:ferric-dicitrate binding protein FerR (iron transport regulator)